MVPPGYEPLRFAHAVAVARVEVTRSISLALVDAGGARATLHEYASRHPQARALEGRSTAYAVPLPQSAEPVVVRHNRHGGMFAALTRDVFLSPTRAPYELEVSLELAKRGVPTPQIVAYVLYPPEGLLQRADVCSREIGGSMDLVRVLSQPDAAARSAAFDAAARLVAALARAGARHHDLNAKNILVTPDRAYILDVDRVTLDEGARPALEANLARLTRSLRKWRDKFGALISERDIAQVEADARRAMRG